MDSYSALSAFERDLFSVGPRTKSSKSKKPARVSLETTDTAADDSSVECIEQAPPKKKTKKQQKADAMANKTKAQRNAAKFAVGSNAITKPTSHIDHHAVLDGMMNQLTKSTVSLDDTLKTLTSPKHTGSSPLAGRNTAVESPNNSKILRKIEQLSNLKQLPANSGLVPVFDAKIEELLRQMV